MRVVHDAPWLLTMGASSTDRRIRATVRLGNGTHIEEESAYQPDRFNSTMLSIVFPGLKVKEAKGVVEMTPSTITVLKERSCCVRQDMTSPTLKRGSV